MSHVFLHHRNLWSLDRLSRRDVSSLLQTAESLKAAEAAGRPQQPLRGKNIALMSESGDDLTVQGFTAAASALGARVAHIRPTTSRLTDPGGAQTALLLGRLYDAIECEGLPGAVVRDLEREAGRPVFNGLADASHPLRVLGDLMTLREHSGKPFEQIRVCFRGDAASAAGQAWRQSAALAGFELRIASPEEPLAANDDFICDELAGGRCADGRVEIACTHAAGCASGTTCQPLGQAQMANQHYALQAILCSAVA